MTDYWQLLLEAVNKLAGNLVLGHHYGGDRSMPSGIAHHGLCESTSLGDMIVVGFTLGHMYCFFQ